MALVDTLIGKSFGLAGERKACALVCLAFYTAFFGLLALLLHNAPPDQPELRAWAPCFAALGACYGLSFFALGAGWFWARWFAIGLGYSGVTLSFWIVMKQHSIEPVIAFYGITHGIIVGFLQGERLVAEFDAKPDWQKLFGLDDKSVIRVRHTVTRAAASLPGLIMIALAPGEGQEGLFIAGLAICGLFGILRMRTIGVVALLAAGLALPWPMLAHHHHILAWNPLLSDGFLHLAGLTSAFLLVAASLPFARPVARFLTSRAV